MDFLFGLALSMHAGFAADYNNIHPHIRLQKDSFISGVYYNSEDALSLYAGIEIKRKDWAHEVGFVTGYSALRIYPFFRSTYSVSDSVNFFIAPGLETTNNETNLGLVFGIEVWNF